MRVARIAIVSGLTAVVAACGANTLRLETASTVATSANNLASQSEDALDAVRERRLRANSVLIASDASCNPVVKQYIHIDGSAPFCTNVADAHTELVDFRPISDEVLHPTVLLIGALALYADALSNIVEQPKVDLSAKLATVADDAASAEAAAKNLGIKLPDVAAALSTDQAKAAASLLQLVLDLRQEARQVEQIRGLVAENDPRIAKDSAQAAKSVDNWLVFSGHQDSNIITSSLNRTYLQQKTRQPFEQRLAMLSLMDSEKAAGEQLDGKREAIANAFQSLTIAREHLTQTLAGNYSKADRARIAQVERERVIIALKALSSLLAKAA